MTGLNLGGNPLQRRAWLSLVLWTVIALVAYVVIIEHGNHVLDFLPYALLLVCPLMHVFMHRRHGHHAHRHSAEPAKRRDEESSN